MNQTDIDQKSNTGAAALARLSQPHGYRIEGDTAHLHAKFTILDPAADEHQWALQLWACPSVPTSAAKIAGHLVAEVALPPMSEAADEHEHMDMTGLAVPPAGEAEYFMVLALAAGRPGRFTQVHDFVIYPRTERFVQPGLRGNVGYRIEGNRVHFSVDRIENPRAAANLSGTLALQLWALPEAYTGGAFEGFKSSEALVGLVSGQAALDSVVCEAPFAQPPSGTWRFVLMLREWTAAGYVSRDFTNFELPVTFGLKEDAKPAAPASTGSAPVALLVAPAAKEPVITPKAKRTKKQASAAKPAALRRRSQKSK